MIQTEYEYRFRLAPSKCEALLGQLDWSAPVTITDVMFGTDGIRSMETSGWTIRLRMTGTGDPRLEYKQRTGVQYAWGELSLRIDDPTVAAQLMVAIGLRPGLVLRKERRTALLPPVVLALDRVDGLGDFLEVEGPQEIAELPEVVDRILGPDRRSEPAYGDLMLRLEQTSDKLWSEIASMRSNVLAELGLPDARSSHRD